MPASLSPCRSNSRKANSEDALIYRWTKITRICEDLKKQYIKSSIDETYLIQVHLAWDAIAKSYKLLFNYDHLLVIILREYS